MRDVAVLRGHEKGVTTLAWHPIHPSLISTGGDDGALHTYLLTEPNTPTGISTNTTSPYTTPDPRSAPPQSIYPAHKITHAHESSIWSLDWHPIGHILASGSNDHYTRFWSRSLPGSTTCFKDQFHLGEEGAEAQGTWDRKFGSRQKREAEEQEEEDEEEGLEEQREQPQGNTGGIPGLPGIGMQPPPNAMPGLGNLPPPPQFQQHPDRLPRGFQGMPPMPPGMTPSALQQLMQNATQHRNPLPSHLPPPPPGTFNQAPGQPIDFSRMQQMSLPQGFPPPPPGASGPPPGLPGIPGLGSPAPGGGGGIPGLGGEAAGGRRRAPLPSQSEGFKMEQARGNFRHAR